MLTTALPVHVITRPTPIQNWCDLWLRWLRVQMAWQPCPPEGERCVEMEIGFVSVKEEYKYTVILYCYRLINHLSRFRYSIWAQHLIPSYTVLFIKSSLYNKLLFNGIIIFGGYLWLTIGLGGLQPRVWEERNNYNITIGSK